MKRFLLTISMVFALSTAHAVTPNISGWENMSDVQKAEIELQVAQNAVATGPVKAKEVQEWINVGKSIGVGFGAAAEELGVGVDKLMASDTGKIAMVLIVWHYLGDQMLGVFGGLLWFSFGIPLWFIYFKRIAMEERTEQNKEGKIIRRYVVMSDDAVIYFSILGLIIFAVGFILIFA